MSGTDFAAARAALEAGQGTVLVRERVADLDTPVGAVTDKFNPKQTHRHLMKELPDAIVLL